MKELDAAQAQLRERIASKKAQVSNRFADVREFYTPANMVSNALGNIAPMFDLRGLLLSIIRDIRTKLQQ